ncbi:Bestrophin, RFP-TM, chloride channel-domain-containing protein [Gigaspora rosea]|uniref:Bestrophin, RFP-TM, chloride channel-domain-containing protein n=1 Tax=Gigaspora rosea TaxID=44941 RepID=A0A397VBE1_9GLOM|nr:Bestrophin, RFP-TM, chloride channel-domain-containing protein [Gigaspora rosea]
MTASRDSKSLSSRLVQLTRKPGYGWPVFLTIIPVVASSTIFTTIICILYMVYGIDLTLPDNLIGSVSVVVGLLLAFRTNHAYDRYYEGRKLFSSMCNSVRNATRAVWVAVKEKSKRDHEEKEDCIKLLLAFVIATKHHLRLEFGTKWSDLEDLLPSGLQLTKFDGNADQNAYDIINTADNEPEITSPSQDTQDEHEQTNEQTNETTSLLRKRSGLPSVYSALRSLTNAERSATYFDGNPINEVDASMSLPLEIIFHLGIYLDRMLKEHKLDFNDLFPIAAILNSLIETLGSLERIGNTPIPLSYKIHLKQAVTLYVWALPFTLVKNLGWVTIPAMAVISYILFGVEAIGSEIENPFGYDINDLPLDDYCKDLSAEIKYLYRHITANVS